MRADLRGALRQLRKTPGVTTTAVLTLALGIGATTAIFTLVHQVLLKSLPVTKPEELWRIGDKDHQLARRLAVRHYRTARRSYPINFLVNSCCARTSGSR